MRIVILANTAWYLHNFRLNLITALKNAGHQVVSISPTDDYVSHLEIAGVDHREWRLTGAGVNPIEEAWAVFRLYILLRREKPDVVLLYTPKGNIYGAFAAKMAGAKTVHNVSGLGCVFIDRSILARAVKYLYRLTFRWASHSFFQNEEDMAMFLEEGITDREKAERLPGSGVDLRRFVASGDKNANGSEATVFLLVARMLWDKGVGEFVAAARQIKQRYPQTKFQLLGFVGIDNPSAIPREIIASWEDEGIVEYLGTTNDVARVIRGADCVVLPSYYREGVPRTLLEAASMGKPLITTDAPGCRDTVDDGVTGFVCRIKDSSDLADKMLQMIALTAGERAEMGRRGRIKMEKEFDERIVIDRYLKVVHALPSRRSLN